MVCRGLWGWGYTGRYGFFHYGEADFHDDVFCEAGGGLWNADELCECDGDGECEFYGADECECESLDDLCGPVHDVECIGWDGWDGVPTRMVYWELWGYTGRYGFFHYGETEFHDDLLCEAGGGGLCADELCECDGDGE